MTRDLLTRRAALLGRRRIGAFGDATSSRRIKPSKKLLESAENLSLGGQRLVLNSSAPAGAGISALRHIA